MQLAIFHNACQFHKAPAKLNIGHYISNYVIIIIFFYILGFSPIFHFLFLKVGFFTATNKAIWQHPVDEKVLKAFEQNSIQ